MYYPRVYVYSKQHTIHYPYFSKQMVSLLLCDVSIKGCYFSYVTRNNPGISREQSCVVYVSRSYDYVCNLTYSVCDKQHNMFNFIFVITRDHPPPILLKIGEDRLYQYSTIIKVLYLILLYLDLISSNIG